MIAWDARGLGPPPEVGALVRRVLAPTTEGPFADRIGFWKDDQNSKRLPKWGDCQEPPIIVRHLPSPSIPETSWRALWPSRALG